MALTIKTTGKFKKRIVTNLKDWTRRALSVYCTHQVEKDGEVVAYLEKAKWTSMTRYEVFAADGTYLGVANNQKHARDHFNSGAPLRHYS